MAHVRPFLLLALIVPALIAAEPGDTFDYSQFERALVQRGLQAMLMCNGLFTSNRTLEQVFAQELAYLDRPIGTARGGDYVVDKKRRAVAVGAADGIPVMRAAYRDGLSCVAMAPDQTFDDIDSLPRLPVEPPLRDPATVPWPDGDTIVEAPLPPGVKQDELAAAARFAFQRESPEQVTLSLLVVYKGRIVHEQYAPGIDVSTRTRTWSTAKSIAATLIGMQVDRGTLTLDRPLAFDWLPEAAAAGSDPRNTITLRHVLNMSSGLFPVDSFDLAYGAGSDLAYWAGASSIRGARSRALFRTPGTFWDYENYDTLLAVYALKRALGGGDAYLTYPRRALFDRIGMHNTVAGVDRFGDFILSSQVYTNARDLARFGLLYLNDGMWNGERLLSSEWIRFVRTPAPATEQTGKFYGGQWWLVPDGRSDVPHDAYSTAGNRGQFVVVVPSHELLIVRRGLDYGQQGFNQWDLAREVLKALPPGN